MRIKDGGSGLDDANGLVICLNLVDGTSCARDYSEDIKSEVLGVEIGGECERKTLLLSSWNLNTVLSCSEIADHSSAGVRTFRQWLQSGESSSDSTYGNGLVLIVCEIQHSFCRVTIDKLDAKDFG